MNRIENLPEVTDRALDGLRADERLKNRIIRSAVGEKENASCIHRGFQLIPVILSSVAVMILCVFLLNGKKPVDLDADQHLIHSFSAGNSDAGTDTFDSFAGTDPQNIESMEIVSAGKTDGTENLQQLFNALTEDSALISDKTFAPEDQLNIRLVSGIMISLPVKAPYIFWPDGIRRCDHFFDLFENLAD